MTEPLTTSTARTVILGSPALATLEQTAETAYTSFARREPAVLSGLLGGPILGLVTLIVPGHAEQLAGQITAAVVAVLVALTGFVVRRYVAPSWQYATGRQLPAFPDPAAYGDAFDDGTGVPHPQRPAVSARRPEDLADEVTGVISASRPSPAGRHEADVAASSSDASGEG